MRRSRFFFAGIAMLLVVGGLQAAEPDYDSIAANLVNQSLAVQPGEIVVINGGVSEVDLMSAIVVAVSKAGGQPVVTLNLPKAGKRAVMETPMEHLGQLPTAGFLLTKMADVFINVGSVQDPGLFADVPEERLAAGRQAGVPLTRVFNTMRFRSASLGQTGGIPTAAYAKSVGADHQETLSIFWKSVGVSPEQLASRANKVASVMTAGAEVRITSEAGTDLKFKVDAVPPRINAGRTADVTAPTGPANVWLPAGEAYGCVKSGSASGTLVVPWTMFRGKPVEDLKLTFKNGRVASMSAGTNAEMLERYFEASSDELEELSVIDIGLNPHSRTPSGSHYYSWEMGGMVSLGLGNNSWAGGSNESDASLSFHVAGTTLSVGGAKLVEGGKLAM